MTRIAGYKFNPTDQVFLGPKIQELLGLSLLKQSEVARRVHIDASLIYLWSIDRRPVPHNRIEALAEALEVVPRDLMQGGRVVPSGAAAPYYLRIAAEIAPVSVTNPVARKLIEEYKAPPPQLTFEDIVKPSPVGPSEVRLLWCESTHGTGIPRRHHHGVAPSWGPGFMTLEKSPPPYVRKTPAAVSGIHRAPRQAPREPTRATTPAPPLKDVLIDPRQWKDDPAPPAAPVIPKPARVVKPKPEPRPVTSAPCGLCGEPRLTSYAAVTEHARSAAHLAAVARSSPHPGSRDEDAARLHHFHVTIGIACNCTGKRHCACGALIVWKLVEPVPTSCSFCGSAVAAA